MYFILNPLISSVWPVPTVCIRIFWLAPKASCLYSRFCEIEALCCYNHQSVLIVSNGNNAVYPISVYITHLEQLSLYYREKFHEITTFSPSRLHLYSTQCVFSALLNPWLLSSPVFCSSSVLLYFISSEHILLILISFYQTLQLSRSCSNASLTSTNWPGFSYHGDRLSLSHSGTALYGQYSELAA